MILLDTHALVWWVNGDTDRLSAAAIRAIEGEMDGGRILLSSISAWEVAMLVSKGRLGLSRTVAAWLALVGEIEAVHFVPLDNEIAVASTELPGDFHRDSADRIIVATGRRFAVPVVTADERIHDYPHIRTIW